MAKMLFNSITLLSLFLILILSIFFFVTKKGNKTTNLFLALLLLLFGCQVIFGFTVSNYDFQYFMDYHKPLFLLKQTGFLTGPVIFLYSTSFHTKRFSLLPNLKHTIPFVLAIILIPFYYAGIETFVLWEHNINLYNTILILIHNLFYIILSVKVYEKSGKSFREFFDGLKRSSHFSWLQYILFGYIIIWIINVNSLGIIVIVKKPGWCSYTGGLFALASFLFINLLMFILLLKPEIYYTIEKYKSSSLTGEAKNEYLYRLGQYFDNKKPYLLPEISIDMVAKETAINARSLSQLINETYNNNFNGYINGLRMQECIRQLSDPYNQKTVLEILYDSGFNSKSAFYTEFKKHTGLTPQEFRARNACKLSENISAN